jgi:PKD repeat protein
MKRLRNIFLIKMVFLLVIFSLFTTDPALVYGDKTGTRVLAWVEVSGNLTDTGLPVYAHLQDASGKDYALVIASQAQLVQAGVQYRILDQNAQGAEYFILTMLSKNKRVPTEQLDNVLLDDGAQVITRSGFQQIESLSELGVEVKWLGHTPLVLNVAPQPEASTLAVTYDPVINQLIGQVTQSKVDTYVRNLSGANPVTIGGSSYTISTRNTTSGTPIEKATQYVYEFMQSYGLTVSYYNWSASGYTGRDVIGELTGTTNPDEIVLITAHLDDMPSGSTAPGADDNASGSVGVMVGAELLSQQAFSRTVRFVVFTGEEQWLLGSAAYSDKVYQDGDDIKAVYNMDMISYDGTGGPDLRLHTRITSNPGYASDLAIANTFIDVVNAYSLSSSLTPIIDADGITQSDHSSFWDNGYPAILGIEEHDNDISPYYHTTSDTVSTLNMTYFTNFVKAAVGTAAHLAIRDDGTVSAAFTGSPTSGPVPLTVNFTDQSTGATSWSWNFGDSGTSTLRNSHQYTSAGTYTVSLTASGASGSDTETKSNYITVTAPQPPVANFTASTTNPTVGASVTFTDTSTNSPTSWSWTFEGGTPAASTAQNPVITYNTVGTYDVSLTAANAQGSDNETKVDYINVSAVPYCTSQGSNYSYEWIARVVVGALDNSSGAAGYTDFTNITGYLTGGNSVSVGLTPGFSSSSYTEYWKIWIDYNGDHDFADTGEEEFSGSGTSTVTGSFTVNTGVDIVTRMRVTMKYNAAPTSCETFSYGEVEDYTVDVSPAVPQPPVAAFTGSPTSVVVGGSVTFTDQSTNTPTSWSWSFEGGTPSASTSQNPAITYNTVGTYDVSLTAYNSSGSDNETKYDYITVTSAPSDDIAEAVDYTSLTFTKSGNANWSRVTDVYYYGNDSAKSGTITHSQSTTIETSVTVGSTQAVKFYWKVSSEASYDYLRFYIDGTEKTRIAGTVNWTQVSYNIAAGTHTLKWSYTKDASASSGSDCGWVDKLEITAPAADPIAEAVDYPGLTFTLSGNANWFSQTTTTYYGGDAAQSGDIGNSQTSTMETTISGKTSVKFYWRVSSETNYDYLRFYIDGVEQAKIAGSTSWAQKTYTVTSGSHTLKWSFTKDSAVSSGSDCGWVDKLELQ